MRTLAAIMTAVGLSGCGGIYYRDTRPVLTVDEVVAMKQAGVDESVLLAKVETSRVPGPLKASDIVSLKEKGIQDKLLEALVQASAEPPPAVYRSYYGSPYAYDFWYPYGYYPYYYYGPRYSFSYGYGYPYYPYYYRYPHYGGYRTYRSYPSYGGSPTYRSYPAR